jgi:hypothetical protein
MYGAMELAEAIGMGKLLSQVPDQTTHPHFTVRALKFDLPWSPYRYGLPINSGLG